MGEHLFIGLRACCSIHHMKGFLLMEIGVPKGKQKVMRRQDVDNNLKDNKKLMSLADSRLTFSVVCYKKQTSNKMEA